MSGYLLDVNVLLALVWPSHGGHSSVHAWFARTGHREWATCALTQLGVLRLLTNPVVTRGTVNPIEALEALVEVTRHPGCRYWALEHTLSDGLRRFAPRIQGFQQWTDTALLWLAVENQGVLVTFDAALKELATRELAGQVLLLKHN
jgi:toxin-antitoxin system PIN domain toxin